MEILLKQGDRLPIPEGCKAVINGNEVVIEKKENEDGKFKEGDVLISSLNGCMVIFKKYKDAWRFDAHYNDEYDTNTDFNNCAFRHATDEEKQQLFDNMKEQGLRWNAEEKRVEKIRWRAEKGEIYYFVDANGNISRYHEDDNENDKTLWRIYNYFQDYKQAEKAAEVVKEVLRKFHEENG